MSTITKGSRVGYTVMYGTRPHTRYVTEFGRITRMWPPGAPAMARIAVEDPKPGRATYVIRKIRDIELADPPRQILAMPSAPWLSLPEDRQYAWLVSLGSAIAKAMAGQVTVLTDEQGRPVAQIGPPS